MAGLYPGEFPASFKGTRIAIDECVSPTSRLEECSRRRSIAGPGGRRHPERTASVTSLLRSKRQAGPIYRDRVRPDV